MEDTAGKPDRTLWSADGQPRAQQARLLDRGVRTGEEAFASLDGHRPRSGGVVDATVDGGDAPGASEELLHHSFPVKRSSPVSKAVNLDHRAAGTRLGS